MAEPLRPDFELSPRSTNLFFGWLSNDWNGIEIDLCAENGLQRSFDIPSPQEKHRRFVRLGLGLQAKLEWGSQRRDGMELATLKVSCGPYSFTALEDPADDTRWLNRAISGEDEYFEETYQRRLAFKRQLEADETCPE